MQTPEASAKAPPARSRDAVIRLTAFAFMAFWAFPAPAADAASLPAVADTFTAPSDADKNYNGVNYVRVRETGDKIGLLRFDPAALQGRVDTAILNLYVQSVAVPGQIEIHEIQGQWNESTVTHNTRPPIGSAVIATVPVAAADAGRFIRIDIAAVVQKWSDTPSAAYGIALLGRSGVDARMRQKEGGNGAFIEVSQGAGPGPAGGPDLLYFSTLGNTAVPGVVGPYDDADIYRYDSATGSYDRVFDARNAGLPSNADIDALHVIDPMTFYMSFDRDDGTNVPGLGLVMDEDVVVYRAGTFSRLFRGTDIGLGDDGAGEDVDGLYVLSNSSLLISTTGSPSVPGVAGSGAEDILRCDGSFGPVSHCSWTLYFDGGNSQLGNTARENINALFEFDNDLYFSTHGNFSVPGLAGDRNDIAHCEQTQNGTCAAFSRFFDGAGLTDDIDAAHFAAHAFADADPATFRTVVLGSSTAAGSGASSAAKSWVGLFNAWLASATAKPRLINLAKSGLTTEPFRPQASSAASDPNRNIDRVVEINADLVFVNLPTNNVAANIPIATTIGHYSEIVAKADAAGIPIFIMTSQPRNFADPAQRLLLRDEAIAIRTAFGARVIDTYDELADFNNGLGIKQKYDSGDGTHLNDAGHQYLFDTVRSRVSAYVTP